MPTADAGRAFTGSLEHPATATSWLGGALRVSFVLAPAALAEELLSRGYILSVLAKWWGWPWAIATTSSRSALLHMFNPGATVESIALVTLAGVFLGAVLFATRSLYAAWAAHFAWNWTMAVVFHAAVSGLPLESPDYRYVDAGPDWATGGRGARRAVCPPALGMIAGSVMALFARRGRNDVSSTGRRIAMAERVAVIGAGQMGNGIAHVFAQSGFDVTMIDVSADALERGRDDDRGESRPADQEGNARSRATRTRSSAASRRRSRSTRSPDASLVVEAATENRELKFRSSPISTRWPTRARSSPRTRARSRSPRSPRRRSAPSRSSACTS